MPMGAQGCGTQLLLYITWPLLELSAPFLGLHGDLGDGRRTDDAFSYRARWLWVRALFYAVSFSARRVLYPGSSSYKMCMRTLCKQGREQALCFNLAQLSPRQSSPSFPLALKPVLVHI